MSEFLRPHGIAGAALNRVEVVLEELVSNVVRHSGSACSVDVQAGYREGSIDLVVEDDGPAFDPFGVPEPTPFKTLAEAPLGGLGVHLVRKLTTSACYERIGTGAAGRNRIRVMIANA